MKKQKSKDLLVYIIRHEHTNYDELLMKGRERFTARDQVENKINQILEKWQRGRR